MSLLPPTYPAPTSRPDQQAIDRLVHGAMLQHAKFVLGLNATDDAKVPAALATYGIGNFVTKFMSYASSQGWQFKPADTAYLSWIASRLPN